MLGEKRAQFAFEPAITPRLVRAEDANGVHRWVDAKLIEKIRVYVRNHLLPVSYAKQIGLSNENHGACACLIKGLDDDQIVLGKACARVDQNDPKITARQIRDRFLGASDSKRAQPWLINESDAFCQAIGRQFNEYARNVFLIARIFLSRRKFRQLGK